MDTADTSKRAVREPPRPKPRRVYKAVSLGEDNGMFRVLLDGKPLHTPMKRVVETPSRALAGEVAKEWDAQATHIDPETMPMTKLLSTYIDVVAPGRAAIIDELMKYAEADMLCYRTGHPPSLKARQAALWQPVLDWLSAAHGVALTVGEGLMPIPQKPEAIAALRKALSDLDDTALTAVQAAAGPATSLALALALAKGRLSPEEVFAASQLDETYQMENWGEDQLAVDRRGHIAAEIAAAALYLRLAAIS